MCDSKKSMAGRGRRQEQARKMKGKGKGNKNGKWKKKVWRNKGSEEVKGEREGGAWGLGNKLSQNTCQ